MTTLEDARKALDAYLFADRTDESAILASTNKTIRAYARFAYDAVFGGGLRAEETAFLVIGALIAVQGVRDTLDEADTRYVDGIVNSAVVIVAEKEVPKE